MDYAIKLTERLKKDFNIDVKPEFIFNKRSASDSSAGVVRFSMFYLGGNGRTISSYDTPLKLLKSKSLVINKDSITKEDILSIN